MQPDAVALLWHVRDAAQSITAFVDGRTFPGYVADEMCRMAVERAFMIIGEAIGKLRQIDPQTAERIPDVRQIIAFRNVLVHAYIDIDDRVVWDAATLRLPALSATVDLLLSRV